jgi:hypothetical protein
MTGMCMIVKTEQQLQDGGAPEYMYHDRTAWRFLWAKNMDAAKDIHKEMLPIWISFASIFFAHKKCTTPRCSIMVHVFRGVAIL